MTRSFAGGQNDKDKYELYMAATHFAEIIENLFLAKSMIKQMQDIIGQQSVAVEVRCSGALHATCSSGLMRCPAWYMMAFNADLIWLMVHDLQSSGHQGTAANCSDLTLMLTWGV